MFCVLSEDALKILVKPYNLRVFVLLSLFLQIPLNLLMILGPLSVFSINLHSGVTFLPRCDLLSLSSRFTSLFRRSARWISCGFSFGGLLDIKRGIATDVFVVLIEVIVNRRY